MASHEPAPQAALVAGNEPALQAALMAGHELASQAAASAGFDVCVLQTGETFACKPGETLLQGMARMGKKGIPVGCQGGGCGVCKVAVKRGRVQKTGVMSRAHVSEQEELLGVVLACRASPTERVELEVLGKMQKNVCAPWGRIVG